MPAYVDSSVLLCLLFREPDESRWRALLAEHDDLVSSSLTEAEVYSACSRDAVPLSLAIATVAPVKLSYPSSSLRPQLETVFQSGYCRGADAHHLATALFLDPGAGSLVFLTADKRQKELAGRLGFRTR